MAVLSSDAFELAHTPFDASDVQALALAQQKELRGRYDGVGDIGPAREAAMFKPSHGAFLLGTIEGRVVAPDARGRQPESLGLYASAGFEPIPCYGAYAAQSTSRCFEKTL